MKFNPSDLAYYVCGMFCIFAFCTCEVMENDANERARAAIAESCKQLTIAQPGKTVYAECMEASKVSW